VHRPSTHKKAFIIVIVIARSNTLKILANKCIGSAPLSRHFTTSLPPQKYRALPPHRITPRFCLRNHGRRLRPTVPPLQGPYPYYYARSAELWLRRYCIHRQGGEVYTYPHWDILSAADSLSTIIYRRCSLMLMRATY
jgi:hypothetical protein